MSTRLALHWAGAAARVGVAHRPPTAQAAVVNQVALLALTVGAAIGNLVRAGSRRLSHRHQNLARTTWVLSVNLEI